MDAKPILLVDDSQEDIELMIMALKEEGRIRNKIEVVYDGEEALDYLYRRGKYRDRKNIDPSVILLDLKMPKINGLEVLKVLKNDEELKIIPVVVLTSSEEREDIIASYTLGANAYVMKPLDSFGFMNTMKKLGDFWLTVNMVPA